MTKPIGSAPPRNIRAAQKEIDGIIAWVFDLATDMTGSHAPYEIDEERRALADIQNTVTDALRQLPKDAQILLARELHERWDAMDFAIDQLAKDYET